MVASDDESSSVHQREPMLLAPNDAGMLTIPELHAPTSIVVKSAQAVQRVVGPLSQLRTLLLVGSAGCSSTDLSPILLRFASAENVRFIGVHSFPQMKFLRGLDGFERLEELSVADTAGPLGTIDRSVMQRLKSLYFSASCSTDVSAALECTSLQKLGVTHGQLRRGEYEFVSNMKMLRAVSLIMTRVASLSEVLSGLDLSSVELTGSTVDSLATLQTMPHLRDVVLCGLKGRYSLEQIANTAIERLDVSELKPKNVERSAAPLCSLEHLEFLSAVGVNFVPKSLQCLSELKNLRSCTLRARYHELFPTDARFSFI